VVKQHQRAEKKATMPPAVKTRCVGEKTSTMNNGAIASPINTNPVTLTRQMDDM